MSKPFLHRAVLPWLPALSILIFPSVGSAQYTNGIYAEFNTSMGSYTCALYYAYAPKAVANFIGLATGQRAWLDSWAGMAKTNAFYNGLIFHRVITNFVIQTGSPTGTGNGGPGYSFVDEFTNNLRFDGFGVLAMANSGPDSNGSQFFVTTSNTPSLNDVHTIFGRLYGGSNVVHAINHVATDSQNRPLANVYLNSVNIRRIGSAANNFDLNAQGLPLVTNLNLKISKGGANVSLAFSNSLNVENRLFSSTNLAGWSGSTLGVEISAPVTNTIFRNAGLPREFFRLAQVRYPPTLFVPRNVLNKTLTMNFSAGNGTFVINFNNAGGGTYTWTGGSSGAINLYDWTQDSYRGRFRPIWLQNFGYLMELHLDYDTATTGTFKGIAYPSPAGPLSVSGAFTSSP